MTRHGPMNEFCWMDLKTRDPSGTAVFFSSVLGWEFAVDEEDWRRAVKISAGGERIGGVSDLAQPVYPPGTPPHIAYYLAVDDADHRTALAVANGAQVVVPPFDAGDQGRIATLIDPVGAVLSLWRPRGFAGWPASATADGTPHHAVLACEDPERAREFYARTTGTPLGRAVFREAGPAVTGTTTGSAPQWELALAVDDPDAVIRRALIHGPDLVTLAGEGARRVVRLRSPEGLTFLIQGRGQGPGPDR
ncbi:VOC family protein [Streptomyces sp. NPDC026589]|uniref:VOC family protein n=1 Tax=Streptomyces sp. NPDC026589 TaxID=3155609 RepID=UPI0033CAFDC5